MYKILRYLGWGFFCVVLAWFAGLAAAHAEDGFLDPEQAFALTVATPDAQTLDMHYAIAPGYYMYQERFELRISDASGQLLLYRASTLSGPQEGSPAWREPLYLPAGEVKFDPVFEQDMEVYHGGLTLRAPLEPGANTPLQVQITGQGCSDEGLCYPPMSQEFQLLASAAGYQAQGSMVVAQVPAPGAPRDAAGADSGFGSGSGSDAAISVLQMGDTGMAAWLQGASLWQLVAISFLFGVLLSLTPCVLPMIPILLAIISGQRKQSRGYGLLLAASYVLGMSLVYTVLGVLAGLMGAGLAAWLQSPWVIGVFALLLALFSLAMLDVFMLQAPLGLQTRLQLALQRIPGGSVSGVLVIGMVSALIVGPCVAAPLAGVLLFISQTGDVALGALSLFAMAWGEGLILLLLGLGAGAALPRAGAWMTPLKHVFGLLLLATAWWMARPLLAVGLYVGGWALLGLWTALLLWQASAAAAASGKPLAWLLRAALLLLLAWSLAVAAGLFAGGRDLFEPLAPFGNRGGLAAQTAPAGQQISRASFQQVASSAELDAALAASSTPALLDFYADWCVSCIEMEKFTFSDPQVAARMNKMLLLQADVTKMTAADRQLLERFQLFGPPGIIFFDSQGAQLAQPRVVGFKKAADFIRDLDKALARNPVF